jgi:hypothetical protein
LQASQTEQTNPQQAKTELATKFDIAKLHVKPESAALQPTRQKRLENLFKNAVPTASAERTQKTRQPDASYASGWLGLPAGLPQ